MPRKFAWKPIAVGVVTAGIALLSYTLLDREGANVSANDPNPAPQPSYLKVTSPPRPETAVVPAGTRIQVRLEAAIIAESNSAGDTFSACLYGPLWIDGKFLAPSRSKITGQILNVEASDGATGRARLTLVLLNLILNGKEYWLHSQPLTLGASAYGHEGTAVGAASGVGPGAGDGPATRGIPIAFRRFTFTLSAPVELPVIRKMGGTHSGGGPSRGFTPAQERESATE